MTKTIKVTDGVYDQLTELLRPRETFNDVVERLLAVNRSALALLNQIEGQLRVRVNAVAKLEEVSKT